MPPDEDDNPPTRRDKRDPRRDRTKSPNHSLVADDGEHDEHEEGGPTARRKSASLFSATKLVENLKEANAPSITRLRRQASSDGNAVRGGGDATTTATRSGRRPPGRTLSAQAPRTNPRRLRSESMDMLSQSCVENYGTSIEMDGSNMSSSQGDRRRRMPQRTRSAQDSCLPRGYPATQRTPRARRRPDREEATEEGEPGGTLRQRPPRTRSSQGAFPPRGAGRTPRAARRRPTAEDNDDDDDSVIISDSDEEHDNNHGRKYDDIDRSNASHNAASRRRAPQRTRSTDSGMPTTRGQQRMPRAARRRPSTERSDASPRRNLSAGPGLTRSLTGTPPSSGTGPGLMRTSTSVNNPRSNRSRGGRNTAQELALVTASTRERSPDASLVLADGSDVLRQINSKISVSPIKSRQERRRLREDKEREVLERRMQGTIDSLEKEDKVVIERKEEPWMRRRLKKSAGGGKSNDDSFSFDEAAARQDVLSNHDSGEIGSTVPQLSDAKDFFPVDPAFGVFAAEPLTDMGNSSSVHSDTVKNEDALLSMRDSHNNKLDFSTIS